MCRMMSMVGRVPDDDALGQFRGLAAEGNVLPGSTCGHGDGWGFAAFRGGAPAFFEKSGRSATEDPRFPLAGDALRAARPDTLLCHLRKASKGSVDDVNAHPFLREGIAFCHNGGIRQSELIPVYDLEPEGGTDSERFFLNILGRLKSGEASTLRQAAEQAVAFVHKELPYSSISFLLTDGREVLVWRDYRDRLRPEESRPPENFDVFPRYYTLYLSEKAGAVCSQPLPALAGDWRLLENQTMYVLKP